MKIWIRLFFITLCINLILFNKVYASFSKNSVFLWHLPAQTELLRDNKLNQKFFNENENCFEHTFNSIENFKSNLITYEGIKPSKECRKSGKFFLRDLKIYWLWDETKPEIELLPEYFLMNKDDNFELNALNQEIPTNQYYSLLKKQTLNYIAQNLVARVSRLFDENEESYDYDFLKSSEIMMVFHLRHIDGIKKNGFLNSLQVGHGEIATSAKLTFSNQNATVVAQGLLNLNLNKNVNSENLTNIKALFPKYAYLQLPSQKEFNWSNRIDFAYGDAVAVFNDDIKSRLTFTPGNSFEMHHSFHSRTLNTRLLKKHGFNEPDYHTNGYGEWGHHWEAQIYGILDFEDVKEFLVMCHFNELSKNQQLELIETLKAANKPIYQCEFDSDNNSRFKNRFKRGQLIWSP